MTRNPLYCLDSSSLISGMNRYYPPSNFPGLWDNIDQLISSGRFIVSEEVARELTRRDDRVAEWIDDRLDDIVVPTVNAVTSRVRQILDPYPLLVKDMKNRDRADPFVIAVAQMKSAIVVTEENAYGSANRPKIPYICAELGIECITIPDILRIEGWTF